MCSLRPKISTCIYNVDQYIGFVQPGHNISDVQTQFFQSYHAYRREEHFTAFRCLYVNFT